MGKIFHGLEHALLICSWNSLKVSMPGYRYHKAIEALQALRDTLKEYYSSPNTGPEVNPRCRSGHRAFSDHHQLTTRHFERSTAGNSSRHNLDCGIWIQHASDGRVLERVIAIRARTCGVQQFTPSLNSGWLPRVPGKRSLVRLPAAAAAASSTFRS
jgi:hypothetical protein